jgi:DNA/RNA-binding domain of Phe-tRNA-synthetase-like protein
MKITISPEIKEKTPKFSVGIMTCDVLVYNNPEITKLINSLEEEIQNNISISDVISLPIIKDGRDAYKRYGKDPSRYRLATESLYRRLAKGNKLYRINNVVDLGNILSIRTRKSVAVLDYSQISGDVLIRLGRSTDQYVGIGRGKINIENIPLYEDDIGPFGSVTSDTERTMITSKTKKILLFIISFSGNEQLMEDLQFAEDLYERYANGSNFTKYTI